MTNGIARTLCGLFAIAAAAALPAQQVTATVLGPVEQGVVPVTVQSTMLDVIFASQVQRGAALDHVVLLRIDGAQLLAMDVDVSSMLKTGNTAANVVIKANDVLIILGEQGVHEAAVAERAVDFALRGRLSPSSRAVLLGWRLQQHGAGVRQRQEAARELGQLGAEAMPAVPSLLAALTGEALVAREAVTALGMIGSGAKAALPALEKLAAGDDVQLRERARASLRQLRKALAAPEPETSGRR